MNRKKLIAGNWKMNTLLNEGVELAKQIDGTIAEQIEKVDIAIFPPFTHIDAIKKSTQLLSIGGQDCSTQNSGAYTGEVSPLMLKDLGATMVILGHSERRQYHGESHEVLKHKTDRAIENGLKVIFCVGETLEQRESGEQYTVVERQITDSLQHLSNEVVKEFITIAYEPVWAIGTGKTASPEQAQEVHRHIRELLAQLFTEEVAEHVRILYGGSMKPDNAAELLSQKDIDGGLIGGAALKPVDFLSIINKA